MPQLEVIQTSWSRVSLLTGIPTLLNMIVMLLLRRKLTADLQYEYQVGQLPFESEISKRTEVFPVTLAITGARGKY